MQLRTAPLAAILAGLACANATLVRRDQEPDFKGTFIMKDGVEYSHGAMPIYNTNGVQVYHFNKWDHPNGVSTSILSHPSNTDPIIILYSSDDVCLTKSHFSEPDFPGGAHLSYKIDPRGIKSDRWSFSFVNHDGEQMSYHYHRNVFNKGGEVYESRKNRPKRIVARLQEQVRWEPWLNPEEKGTPTFTLYYDLSSGPALELVTLMALVLRRFEDCGL